MGIAANCISCRPIALSLALSPRLCLYSAFSHVCVSVWRLPDRNRHTHTHRRSKETAGLCLRLVATPKMVAALLIRPVGRFLPASAAGAGPGASALFLPVCCRSSSSGGVNFFASESKLIFLCFSITESGRCSLSWPCLATPFELFGSRNVSVSAENAKTVIDIMFREDVFTRERVETASLSPLSGADSSV